MEADKKNEYLKAKGQVQKFFEAVKDGKLEDIKKAIETFAHQQKDEKDTEELSIRIKNLINDTKVSSLQLISAHFFLFPLRIRKAKAVLLSILHAQEETLRSWNIWSLWVPISTSKLIKWVYPQRNFELDRKDEDGNNALFVAVQHQHDKLAKFLIEEQSNL